MMASQQSQQPIVVPVPMGGGGSTTSPSDGAGGGAPIPSLTSAPSNHIVSSLDDVLLLTHAAYRIMSTNIGMPTQFEFTELEINGVNALQVFVNIEIFENIFIGGVTGSISIFDTDSLSFIEKNEIEFIEEISFAFQEC